MYISVQFMVLFPQDLTHEFIRSCADRQKILLVLQGRVLRSPQVNYADLFIMSHSWIPFGGNMSENEDGNWEKGRDVSK